MNNIERKMSNLYKYKRIIAILTLILFLLSGILSTESNAITFIWPLPGHSHISSPFGPRRVKIGSSNHMGIDIPAPTGTPIVASADGEVVTVSTNKYRGKFVKIKHDGTYSTIYQHHSANLVKVGDKVKQGMTIAKVGSTGKSSGPHLHFEVHVNGKPQNPQKYVSYDGKIKPGPEAGPENNDGGGSSGGNGGGRTPRDYGSGYKTNGLNVITNDNFFYQGAPQGNYSARNTELGMVINFIASIGKFLITLIVNIAVKLPIIGYASLFEVMITQTFNAISGEDTYIKRNTNSDLYVDPRRSVNVENIIYGRVELLNIDFFVDPAKASERMQGLTGTGQEIEEINRRAEIAGNAGTATEYTAQAPNYEESAVGVLRKNYAGIYYAIFAIAIVLMLFALIGAVISLLIKQTANKKAMLKEFMVDWLKGFGTLLFSVFYVFLIIKLNAYFLTIFTDLAKKYLDDGILNKTASIYETIRTRAYDNKFSIGVPAAILYLILVWDTIKFSFIYLKRLIYLLVLAVLGPVSNTFQILSNVFKGTPGDRNSIKSWMKEITYLVFLQTIHAALYTFIMIIVFKLLKDISLVNFVILIGLHTLLYELPKYLKDIFNLSSGGKSAISDTLKTDPLSEMDSMKGVLLGSELTGVNVSNIQKNAKNILGKTTKTAKKVADTVVGGTIRNSVNFGLFLNDARKNKKNNNEELNLTEDEINRRKELIKQIEKSFENSGMKMPDNLKEKLSMYSTLDLNTILSDPNIMEEYKINASDLSLEELLRKDPEFSKHLSIDQIKQRDKKIKKAKILEAFGDKTPFLNENGNYRILKPIKTYNPETKKYEIIKPGSEEYFKKIGKAFGIEGDKFKENKDILMNGLKTGLTVVGAAIAVPALLGDLNNRSGFKKALAGQVLLNNNKTGTFKTFKSNWDNYVVPNRKLRKPGRIQKLISIMNFRKGYVSHKHAKRILENAEKEIIEIQYEDILKAVPDINKKGIKRAKLIAVTKNYTDPDRLLGKEADLRREQNKILEEIRALNVLDMEKDIKEQSKYAKTYFRISNNMDGDLDLLNTKEMDKILNNSYSRLETYKEVLKIKNKSEKKILEAKLYDKSDAEIAKIKKGTQDGIYKLISDKINQLENIDGLDKREVEKLIADNTNKLDYLSVDKIKEEIEIEKEKISGESLKITIDEYKDKNIKEVLKEIESGNLNKVLKKKIAFKKDSEIEDDVSKNVLDITNIFEETVEVEILRSMGVRKYNDALNINERFKKSILEGKIKEVLKENISDKEKIEKVKKAAENLSEKDLYNPEYKKKYLSQRERKIIDKYEREKILKTKEFEDRKIGDIVSIWQKNSKQIEKSVDTLHGKYMDEIYKKSQILDALKEPDNALNMYKGAYKYKNNKQKTKKGIKVDIKKKNKIDEKERRKDLNNLLNNFYKK